MVGEMMEFNLKKESLALYDNMKETTEEAIRGPIGLFSNPIRFMFYAAVLGASQLLIFQVVNGAINRAMDEEKP
tara:strand:- start:326 stop:547 length:222 start_codon:yes stop_codon:yes gene_type:complete